MWSVGEAYVTAHWPFEPARCATQLHIVAKVFVIRKEDHRVYVADRKPSEISQKCGKCDPENQ